MFEKIGRFRRQKAGETSAAELLRECGEKLTDRALWARFQERFQGLIFLYLMRALHIQRVQDDAGDLLPDLAQDVYLKLVQHNGRVLRSFRGTTEFSAMAFLGKVSTSVVHDHLRQVATEKRSAQIVSIDSARGLEYQSRGKTDSAEADSNSLSAILSWIDIERVVQGEADRKNAQRNALIFQLHYIDGFEAAEIARFPGFGLTKSGVQAILARLRKRIPK